jgi:hypothetical protein
MMILRPFWDFWTRPIRAESLALFRILLAVTILGNLLSGIGRTLPQTCPPDGYCPIEANDEWITRGGRLSLLRGPSQGSIPLLGKWLPDWLVNEHPWLNHLQSWTSPETAAAWSRWGEKMSSHYLLFGLYLAALVCLALGLGTRLSALAAALLAATFYHRVPWLANGGDSLFRNGLYFLVLAPAGATWSLDRVIRRKVWRRLGGTVSDEPVMIAPWSVRLIQIQVCCMYLFTGLVKLGDSGLVLGWLASLAGLPYEGELTRGDYIDGQALYWVFNDVAITRWSYSMLPLPLFVCRLMSWTTIAFEMGFSFLVWIRPLRRWVLLLGLGLHVGIFLVMEIGWFSQITLCFYAVFVSGESVSRFFQRLGAWLRGSPDRPAPVPAAA